MDWGQFHLHSEWAHSILCEGPIHVSCGEETELGKLFCLVGAWLTNHISERPWMCSLRHTGWDTYGHWHRLYAHLFEIIGNKMYKALSLAEEHHISSYLWVKKEPVKFRIWGVKKQSINPSLCHRRSFTFTFPSTGLFLKHTFAFQMMQLG